MQLMPETARDLDVGDIYDPTENINGGVRHLKLLLDRFGGNQRMALAAYNAGAKAVERYRGVPPFSETREYVRLVLRYYRLYGNNGGVSLTENGGVRHLKLLLDRFGGNQRMALAAYNAGAKAVERYRGVPPFSETREYVRLVLRYYRLYGNNGGVSLTEQVKR